MKKIILGWTLFLVFSGTARAATKFQLKIDGFFKSSGGCSAASAEVAAIFTDKAGLKDVSTTCRKNRGTVYDIELSYTADEAFQGEMSASWPVYSSHQQCLAGLPAEEKFYKGVTGLTPFVAYCALYSGDTTFNGTVYRFTPVFWSKGEAKLVLRTVSYNSLDGNLIGDNAFFDRFVSLAKESGLPVVQAYFDARDNESDLWVRLTVTPAEKNKEWKRKFLLLRDIESLPWPTFMEPDPLDAQTFKECQTQKTIAETTFSKAFSSPVLWFCSWSPLLFQARLHHLRINPGQEYFDRFSPGENGEPLATHYSSKTQCEADKNKVLNYYRAKWGDAVVGALCSSPMLNLSAPIKMFVYLKG